MRWANPIGVGWCCYLDIYTQNGSLSFWFSFTGWMYTAIALDSLPLTTKGWKSVRWVGIGGANVFLCVRIDEERINEGERKRTKKKLKYYNRSVRSGGKLKGRVGVVYTVGRFGMLQSVLLGGRQESAGNSRLYVQYIYVCVCVRVYCVSVCVGLCRASVYTRACVCDI